MEALDSRKPPDVIHEHDWIVVRRHSGVSATNDAQSTRNRQQNADEKLLDSIHSDAKLSREKRIGIETGCEVIRKHCKNCEHVRAATIAAHEYLSG